jgi:hypothetical protein
MAALFRGLQVRRGRPRVRRLAALAACALATGLLAPRPLDAAATHSIDSLKVSMSRGFVNGTAWFEDRGPGQSRVRVWIETYSGNQLTGSLGHRSGMSSCDPGATCYALLTTSLQTSPGECYVLRAMSARGADLVSARAPSSNQLCS